MLKVYNNPFVIDFLAVAANAAPDQIDQWERMTGFAWDSESAAMGMLQTDGPKWVIKVDDRPVVVAGYKYERKGVWRDYMLTTPDVWTTPMIAGRVTGHVRRAMTAMLESGQAHRLECVSLTTRLAAHTWYNAVGLTYESTMSKFCANGEDALMFVRLKD